MYLRCLCGECLSDIGAPNDTEHVLLSNRVVERFQDLADEEVAAAGIVDSWPEHWENAGSIQLWKCYKCHRLYMNVMGKPEDIIVYSVEQTGLDPERIGQGGYAIVPPKDGPKSPSSIANAAKAIVEGAQENAQQ